MPTEAVLASENSMCSIAGECGRAQVSVPGASHQKLFFLGPDWHLSNEILKGYRMVHTIQADIHRTIT